MQKPFEALKTALNNQSVKAISIHSPGSSVIVTGELTILKGVTVTVERGNDFYIEGLLTNNGIINVMGSDTEVSADFINYSVMSVQKNGKVVNNGAINLLPSVLSDTSDHGPVGGQLRVFDGSFENNGSVFIKAGVVNTHGGKEATQHEAEMKTKPANPVYSPVTSSQSKQTVKEYLEEWVENHGKANLRPGTFAGYKSHIKNHILSFIGHVLTKGFACLKWRGILRQ